MFNPVIYQNRFMQKHDKKQVIRKDIAALKKKLSKETVIMLSRNICGRLVQTDLFQKADIVALYYSMSDEVQTSGLIDEWFNKKKIVLPVISGEKINFHLYKGKELLKEGALGIQEPASTDMVSPEEIDIFVVPGVAFDRTGNRLGRGKGYYDKYLTGTTKPLIGICFDFQLTDSIPTEKHDVKMTMVITENITLSSHHQ